MPPPATSNNQEDTLATNKSDNMNQGLPDHTGLDEGTRARLRAAADGGNDGIVVGSFRDLQLGDTAVPVVDRPLNENVPADANLVTPAEQDAQLGVATQATDEEGMKVEGAEEDTGSSKKSTTKK